jgi:hypothetical protein
MAIVFGIDSDQLTRMFMNQYSRSDLIDADD